MVADHEVEVVNAPRSMGKAGRGGGGGGGVEEEGTRATIKVE